MRIGQTLPIILLDELYSTFINKVITALPGQIVSQVSTVNGSSACFRLHISDSSL